MKLLLYFFLFFQISLNADWEQFFSDTEDLALFHHVNVISGNLNLCMQDAIIHGAKPLSLIRTYTSAGAFAYRSDGMDRCSKYLSGLIQGGWNLFPHANLLIQLSDEEKNIKILLPEPSGNTIIYTYQKNSSKTPLFIPDYQNYGQSSGILSARKNVQNNFIILDLKKAKLFFFFPMEGCENI